MMNKILTIFCIIIIPFFAQAQGITYLDGFIMATDAPNLPDPARWGLYFWEFGDGHYKITTNESVRYNYPKAGNYKITAHLTPFYTVVHKPVRLNLENLAIPSGTSRVPKYDLENRLIAINTNTNYELVPNHDIRTVLHYHPPANEQGYLLLFYNKKGELGNADEAETNFESLSYTGDLATFNQEQKGKISGIYPKISDAAANYIQRMEDKHLGHLCFKTAPTNEEQRLFLTLHAQETLENKVGGERNINLIAVWVPDGINESFDKDVNTVRYNMNLRKVHDPNRIKINPKVAYFRRNKANELKYEIQFQNEADGIVKEVSVAIPIDENLDASSIKIVPGSLWAGSKETRWNYNCRQADIEIGSKCFEVDTKTRADSVFFIFHNIDLQGKKNPFGKSLSKGSFKFTIKTKGKRVFKTRSQADITFKGADPIPTSTAKVKWRTQGIYLKGGLNVLHNFDPYEAESSNLSIGLAYQNMPVGSGISWGIESAWTNFKMIRADSTALLVNQNEVFWQQTEAINMNLLELQGKIGYQLFGAVRGWAGAGITFPAFAKLDLDSEVVTYNVDAEETLIADAVSTGFGLFNKDTDPTIFNQTIETNSFMGYMTNFGLEVGLLDVLSVGAKAEMRFFPKFYYNTDSKCLTTNNIEVFLRLNLFKF